MDEQLLQKIVEEQQKRVVDNKYKILEEISYIADIVKRYWPKLTIEIKNYPQGDSPEETVYVQVRRMLRRLKDYSKPYIVTLHKGDKKIGETLEIKLGFIFLEELYKGEGLYKYSITEEGKKIVEGLEEATKS